MNISLELAAKAVQLYAETHPRPHHVNWKELEAELSGQPALSRPSLPLDQIGAESITLLGIVRKVFQRRIDVSGRPQRIGSQQNRLRRHDHQVARRRGQQAVRSRGQNSTARHRHSQQNEGAGPDCCLHLAAFPAIRGGLPQTFDDPARARLSPIATQSPNPKPSSSILRAPNLKHPASSHRRANPESSTPRRSAPPK